MTIEAPAWKFFVRPASSRNKPEYRAHLAVRQGAPERLQAKLPHELVDTRGVGRRFGLAGNQSVVVTASKGRQGEPLGRLAVGFRLER